MDHQINPDSDNARERPGPACTHASKSPRDEAGAASGSTLVMAIIGGVFEIAKPRLPFGLRRSVKQGIHRCGGACTAVVDGSACMELQSRE